MVDIILKGFMPIQSLRSFLVKVVHFFGSLIGTHILFILIVKLMVVCTCWLIWGHDNSFQWTLVDTVSPMLGLLIRDDVVGCSIPLSHLSFFCV